VCVNVYTYLCTCEYICTYVYMCIYVYMYPRKPDLKECHLAEDQAPPKLMMPPEIDLTDGNYPCFIGEYYMPALGEGELARSCLTRKCACESTLNV